MKIGVDPDVDKSGIAIIENAKLRTLSMDFIQFYEWIKIIGEKIEVVNVEASWLISHNYTSKGTLGTRLNMANKVGANHQIGKEIVKALELFGIKYKLVRPLKKIWKGTNGKITHNELINIWQVQKLNFDQKQTNQEERDAVLLIL